LLLNIEDRERKKIIQNNKKRKRNMKVLSPSVSVYDEVSSTALESTGWGIAGVLIRSFSVAMQKKPLLSYSKNTFSFFLFS